MSLESDRSPEIGNFYSESEIGEISLARAMAIRLWYESERVDYIRAIAAGENYKAPTALTFEYRVQQSVPLIEETLKDPSKLRENSIQLNKLTIWEQFIDRVEKGEFEKLQESPKFSVPEIGEIMEEEVAKLLAPITERSTTDHLRMDATVSKMSNKYGVSSQRIYLDDNLYARACRQTYDPYEYADRVLEMEQHLSINKLKPLITKLVMNLLDFQALDEEEVQQVIFESYETEQGKSELSTLSEKVRKPYYAAFRDFLIRIWGKDVANVISDEARVKIFQS